MKESTIWLEVNVNIGSRSLRINIRKGEAIEEVVKDFIKEHSLSEQYMPIIVSMIRQQVQVKLSQENHHNSYQEKQHIKESWEDEAHYQTSPGRDSPRKHTHTPQHKTTHQQRSRHSPGIEHSKISQTSTTMQKNGTHCKSQMMQEMLKIKEDIDRKKAQELSRVKSRKTEQPYPTEEYNPCSENFTEREQLHEIEEELFNDGRIYQQESRKRKIFKKIEQQREKLSSPFTMLKTKTESSLHQSHLKEDIVQLKGLLSHQPQQERHPHFQQENSYTKHQIAKQSNAASQKKKTSPTKPLAEAKTSHRDQSKQLEQVYNKWKKMEEQRKTQQSNKSQGRSKSKTPQLKKVPQKHEASFFYEKGTTFLKEKNRRNQESFRRLYPFKRADGSVTPDKRVDPKAVSERLYQQARSKSVKKLQDRAKVIIEEERKDRSPQLPPDPIRQQIRRRDKQYDSAVAELLVEGRINNPNKINVKPSGTFRKTRVF